MHITDYQKTQHLEWENLFILDGGDNVGTRAIFAGTLAKELFKLLDPGEFADALNVMEMNRVREVQSGDRLMIGTPQGTKAVEIGEDIYKIMDAYITVPQRNNIYRGKLLGNAVTEKQWEAIQNRSYKDMFIGDYWEINETQWLIAGFEYYINKCSETDYTFYNGHIILIPNSCLLHRTPLFLDNTHSTETGYVGSAACSGDNSYETRIKNEHAIPAFGGSHLKEYTEYFTNRATFVENKLVSTDIVRRSLSVTIPDAKMLFESNKPSVVKETISSQDRLPIFRMNPSNVSFLRETYWTRSINDIYGEMLYVSQDGSLSHISGLNHDVGVRPIVCIG